MHWYVHACAWRVCVVVAVHQQGGRAMGVWAMVGTPPLLYESHHPICFSTALSAFSTLKLFDSPLWVRTGGGGALVGTGHDPASPAAVSAAPGVLGVLPLLPAVPPWSDPELAPDPMSGRLACGEGMLWLSVTVMPGCVATPLGCAAARMAQLSPLTCLLLAAQCTGAIRGGSGLGFHSVSAISCFDWIAQQQSVVVNGPACLWWVGEGMCT